MKNYIYPTRFLLPNDTLLPFWSVVACDQFTSEPNYWLKLKNLIGEKPSTLNLILPEVYLKDDNTEEIANVNKNMTSYLDNGIFNQTDEGFILIERTFASGKKNIGLIATIDLEDYSFNEDTKSVVRTTEKTVLERIPPRLKIRENAPIELSHTILLYDDPSKSINEKLYSERQNFEKIYDFDLLMNGGHITGWFIKDTKEIQQMFLNLLSPKLIKQKYGKEENILFAVGDGNHSMATAKTHWENIKKNLSLDEQQNHPARFFLTQITNLYDDGIYFEPIYRFVKNVTLSFGEKLDKVKGNFKIYNGQDLWDYSSNIDVPTSIKNIDALIKQENLPVDYIHGEENLSKLVQSTRGSVGIIFEPLPKDQLFKYIINNGILPKKTFSMGEGIEKKYYLEAKKI